MALDRLDAGNPESGGLGVLLRLPPLLGGKLRGVRIRAFAVAVMRLVVKHDDILHGHQVGHDPP